MKCHICINITMNKKMIVKPYWGIIYGKNKQTNKKPKQNKTKKQNFLLVKSFALDIYHVFTLCLLLLFYTNVLYMKHHKAYACVNFTVTLCQCAVRKWTCTIMHSHVSIIIIVTLTLGHPGNSQLVAGTFFSF